MIAIDSRLRGSIGQKEGRIVAMRERSSPSSGTTVLEAYQSRTSSNKMRERFAFVKSLVVRREPNFEEYLRTPNWIV